MTTFNDRDQAFENKFAHDQELRFKVIARRNKLLGLWAAAKMAKKGADAEAYAKEVVMADFEETGDEDVLRKVHGDLTRAGLQIAAPDIRREMDLLMDQAKREIMEETQ